MWVSNYDYFNQHDWILVHYRLIHRGLQRLRKYTCSSDLLTSRAGTPTNSPRQTIFQTIKDNIVNIEPKKKQPHPHSGQMQKSNVTSCFRCFERRKSLKRKPTRFL